MPIQNGVVMRPCAVYLNNTSWIHDLTDRGYKSLSVIGESWLDSTNYSVLRRLHQRKWVSFLMIKFEQFIHGKQTYNWAILQNTSMIQYKSTVILSWQSQEGSFDMDSWVLSSSRPFLYTLTDGCCCRDTVRIPPMLFCTSRRTCHKSSSFDTSGVLWWKSTLTCHWLELTAEQDRNHHVATLTWSGANHNSFGKNNHVMWLLLMWERAREQTSLASKSLAYNSRSHHHVSLQSSCLSATLQETA